MAPTPLSWQSCTGAVGTRGKGFLGRVVAFLLVVPPGCGKQLSELPLVLLPGFDVEIPCCLFIFFLDCQAMPVVPRLPLPCSAADAPRGSVQRLLEGAGLF